MKNKMIRILSMIALAPAVWADTPVPQIDEDSEYGPTLIVNGHFLTQPTYKANPQHGVGEGWNTTDSSGFEWAHPGGYTYSTYGLTANQYSSDNYFIEMNNSCSAVFSQDLATKGGDVIRWGLAHGYRNTGGEQRIRAEIGAPNGATSGTGSSVYANIKNEGKAIYTYNNVSHPAGVVYGYPASLGYLRLPSGSSCTWYPVTGIYVIPEGQTVTRFAFIAESPTNGAGNCLDTLTFNTLIGNLSANANEDGSVTVKGYWGDTDSTKKLCVKIGTGSTVLELAMSGVVGKNFTVTIPSETIGDAAKLEVYHQDYQQASRTVKIAHPYSFTVVANDDGLLTYCTNANHSAEGGCDHAGADHGISLGLVANSAPYTGTLYDRAKVTGDTNALATAGLPQPTLSYAKRGTSDYSLTAPVAAGFYTAKMTLNGVSVTKNFEIEKITAGAFELVSSALVKLPVTIDGSMTLYTVTPNGAKVQITAATGTGWKFQDAVVSASAADKTPVAGKDYLSISLVVDKDAIGSKTIAEVAEEALATLRYTRATAEVKITGTYLGEGVALQDGDYFLNGHFYTLSSGCLTWNNAMVWAFNLMTSDPTRYPGYKSYPVVITSAEENDLLVNIWNNAHPEYEKHTEVWLPSVPVNITDGTITIGGTEGARTVTVTGVPKAAETDTWTRNGITGKGGTYGMGERYKWMDGVPEAGQLLPAETNVHPNNGTYWSYQNPSDRGVNYFGHPNIGAVWDDLAPAASDYNYNAWTAFSQNGTFHMYGLTEWEAQDPETIVTVTETAKEIAVTFVGRASDATCGGAAFTATNTVRMVGSTAAIPVLACDDAVFCGWSNGGIETYTAEQIAAIDPAVGSAAETWTAVWKTAVRIPVFVALDGLGVVPTDGRTYEFAITNGSVTTPLQACCTNVTLACPIGTGDVYRVGFATNDVANPWTLYLGEGTYVYNIHQKTVARPGEQLAEGYWRTCVAVDMTEMPHVVLTENQYLDAIDDLSEGAFKAFKVSGEASFSSEERYIILGSDTQKAGDAGDFNRALVKSRFTFDFTRSFRVDGTMQVGNAADGTAVGFVPNGEDLNVYDDFSDEGSALGVYRCAKNGHGLFLEFDTLGDGGGWGGETDYLGGTAHFVLTTTDATGYPSNVKGQHVIFSDNYGLPSGVMNYSIDYDSFSKEMLFTIKDGINTWKLCYTNPPAVFGTTKAYMALSGAMRYSPAGGWGVGSYGSPAPKTKITIATFNYVNDSMTGAVENTFRNRQEAFVTYNAWGGAFADGVETNSAYANGARYDVPAEIPTRNGYTFDGWYASWTNGAAQVAHGGYLDPIVDRTIYAKWISKSSPEPEPGEDPTKGDGTLDYKPVATNADGSAVIGAGALLKGATNTLQKTDLAVPEFTSNGPDGVPYVIIEEGAFARENYDKKRERELLKQGVPRAQSTTNDLTSVTVSTYVTNIQSFAFSGCNALTNVTFTKTRDYLTGAKAVLHIRDWAFQNSGVRSVTFPADSKVVLDYGSFADAEYLADITFLGDVELKAKYPFVGCGTRLFESDGTTRKPVTLHLSAKLAANTNFVASLTNGMSAARVALSQQIEGKVDLVESVVTSDPMVFTFTVSEASPWLKVTTDTVYLFYSATFEAGPYIGNTPLYATEVEKNDDGSYTAKFAKPSGASSMYFQLCIGDPR